MTLIFKSSILLGTVALFGTLSGLAIAQSSQSADNKFAREAATGGMEEVELGKVAVRNASNDKVKAFGQRMIDDHSKANDELKMVASKNNITLPTSLDAKQKAEVDHFSAMSGPAFDRAYMRDMVRDHEKDIAAFEHESSKWHEPRFKELGNKYLAYPADASANGERCRVRRGRCQQAITVA